METDAEKESKPGSLDTEIAISERNRITLVIAFLLALGVFQAVVTQWEFQGEFAGMRWFVISFLAVAIAIEAAMWLSIRRRRNAGCHPVRYAMAFLETSIPTVAILAGSTAFTIPVMVNAPPSYGYFLFIILSTLRLDARLCVFTGFVAAAEFSALTWIYRADLGGNVAGTPISLLQFQMVKGVIFFAGGLFAAFVSFQIRQAIERSRAMTRERNRIVEMFGQHVSPAVVNKLLEQKGQFFTETRSLCVLFVDIRDFTKFSEKTSPEEVVNFLNILFDMMISVINKNDGIVNKFLGDGLMALFGAPLSSGQDATNAVKAASEMLDQIEEMVASGKIRATRLGIGIHGGEVVTGQVGSSQRKEYTVIGDVVNVSSRIEQLNKDFGSTLLVSDFVWKGYSKTDPPEDKIHIVQVKGRSQPLRIVRLR